MTYQISNLHVSATYALISTPGQEHLGDPAYTITASVLVTDESDIAASGQPVTFVALGVAGSKVGLFDPTHTGTAKDEGGNATITVQSDGHGVATALFCGYTHLIIQGFYAQLPPLATPALTMVFWQEADGNLPFAQYAPSENGELTVDEAQYSFLISASQGQSAQDKDPTAIFVNGQLLTVVQYSDLLGQNTLGGVRAPYNMINFSAPVNTIYYFAQSVPGTPYLSQLPPPFGAEGTPVAMPDPYKPTSLSEPRPNPALSKNTLSFADLSNGYLKISIPASAQLQPYDKVELSIYVNGYSPSTGERKSYTRSFTYTVPEGYDADLEPFIATLSAQFFYNFSRNPNPGGDQLNKLFFDYGVNDLQWSSAWSWTPQSYIDTAIE